jgi:protein-tyrosine phosphatase
MPIRRELKAFWWFVDGRVGGMGRPGFNQCHWYDLSLEEGMVFGWLGQQSQTNPTLESLWQHLDRYGPKVAPFYHLSLAEVQDRLGSLRDKEVLLHVLDSMNAKAGILQDVTWQTQGLHAMLHVLPNVQRLHYELAMLKHCNVSVLISLLEQPLDQTLLGANFEVHHFPVEDVTPPSYEQVYTFADILHTALAAGKNIVTHCLAGVGRTTTMLVAAYLVHGYAWNKLVTWVRARNPHFQFQGSQVAFLQHLTHDLASGRLPLLSTTTKVC